MATKVTGYVVKDIRFPTSLEAHGSDAMVCRNGFLLYRASPLSPETEFRVAIVCPFVFTPVLAISNKHSLLSLLQ